MIELKLVELAKHDTSSKIENFRILQEINESKIGTDEYKPFIDVHNETTDRLDYLLVQARGAGALSFFGIEYDEDLGVVKFPQILNPIFSKQIVDAYIKLWESTYMEEFFDVINPLPLNLLKNTLDYFYHCRKQWRSDDGGFHYCGWNTYEIFEALEMEYDSNPWN